MAFWGLALIVVAFLVYVRVAPTDAASWHVSVDASGDKNLPGGALRVRPADADTLHKLDAIALQSPRTIRIAGNPDEGRVTYQTRTRWIGFPDYTTAEIVDGRLKVFARLRFGKYDLDVNKTRIDAWLDQL